MVVKKRIYPVTIAFKFSKRVHKNDLKIAYGWVHSVLCLRDTHLFSYRQKPSDIFRSLSELL